MIPPVQHRPCVAAPLCPARAHVISVVHFVLFLGSVLTIGNLMLNLPVALLEALPTADHEFLAMAVRVSCLLLLIHFCRLYISLDIMDAAPGFYCTHQGFLCHPLLRFLEFLARVGVLSTLVWVSWKLGSVTGLQDISEPTVVLYKVLLFWDVFMLAALIASLWRNAPALEERRKLCDALSVPLLHPAVSLDQVKYLVSDLAGLVFWTYFARLYIANHPIKLTALVVLYLVFVGIFTLVDLLAGFLPAWCSKQLRSLAPASLTGWLQYTGYYLSHIVRVKRGVGAPPCYQEVFS